MDITDARSPSRAAPEVTALYAEHALGLVRRLAALFSEQPAESAEALRPAQRGAAPERE